MPNIEVNGTVVQFPDSLSGEELRSAVEAAAGQGESGFFKTYPKGAETLPQKADVAAGNAARFGLDVLKAPYDVVGEAMTAPIEGRPMKAPSVLGGDNPADPLATINKLLRAGASALTGIPSGNPMEMARAGYNAPRGAMGPVEDTAMGLLLGKVAPTAITAPADAAAMAVEKAASGAKSLASTVAKKAIRTGLGPTEEAQKIAFNRPEDLARQTDFNGLGTRFADTIASLKDKVSELDNKAWDTLVTLKAEPQAKLVQILKNVKSDFIGTGKTKIGDSDRQAAAQIQNYIDRVSAIKQPGATKGTAQFLDQGQVKDIIQSIQKDATYGLVKNEPVNRAVKAARAGLDAYLKTENPSYADAMAPLADATSALENATKHFKLELDPNGNLVPGKTTIANLQSVVKGKNPTLDRTLEQLKNVSGVDFKDEAALTAAKQEFTPGVQRTAGSRRAIIGGGLGGSAGILISKLLGINPSVGAAVGGAAGTAAGGAVDYYGGAAAQKVIDLLRRTNSGVGNVLQAVNNKASGTPFQEVVKRLLAGEPALTPILKGNR